MFRRPRPRAVLTASVVAAYGLTFLAGAVHYGLVAHERCEAHGDLVHAEHDGHGAGDHHHDAGSAGLAADVPSDHAHEHCGLGEHLRVEGLRIAADLRAPVPLEATGMLEPAPATAAAHRSIPLALLAPKTSPPA